MSFKPKHFRILFFVLCFYLSAQLFQQYVLRIGPLSSVSGMEETIVAGQHPMNIARLLLVLLSMFFMVIAYLVLTLYFYKISSLLTIASLVFFLFFLLFEIGYRSIELFQVVIGWGQEFAAGSAAIRANLLPRFRSFTSFVDAIYFPILTCHLLASICLFVAAVKNKTGRLIAVAMAVNTVRLLLRLTGFTALDDLNIFSGAWYFPPVAFIFILLIIWSWKMTGRSRIKDRTSWETLDLSHI